MTIDDFLKRVSQSPLTVADLEQAAVELQIDEFALCDMIARDVGEGYLSGKYSWEFGDVTMSNLSAIRLRNCDRELSEFAWQVFVAFDEGEYKHPGTPELDGEPRTRLMLEAILGPRTA